jgi:hypothetical protein
MRQFKFYILATIVVMGMFSCNKNEEPIQVTTDNFHSVIDKVVEVMIHDIFSPPVASRVFAYPNIAAYEILAHKKSD